MRCEYCDCEVTTYPDDGICIHCGGKLPPKPVVPAAPASAAPVVQTVYIPVPQPQPVQSSTGIRCPKCSSDQVVSTNRGFSWGLALLGFFLIPGWGLLLGFIGRKKPRLHCSSCNRKWKPA